jgi:hypothetical protein
MAPEPGSAAAGLLIAGVIASDLGPPWCARPLLPGISMLADNLIGTSSTTSGRFGIIALFICPAAVGNCRIVGTGSRHRWPASAW